MSEPTTETPASRQDGMVSQTTQATQATTVDTPVEREGSGQRSRADSRSREVSSEMDNYEDQVFDVQLSKINEDPNQVNVHQFYPVLEHQFMKSHSNFVTEQGDMSQRAIQEMVEEDPSLKPEDGDAPVTESVATGRATTEEPGTGQSSQMQLVPHDDFGMGTPWSKEDENNSSDPQLAYYMARWQLSREEESRQSRKSQQTQQTGMSSSEGVFSTAVDEQSLAEARTRHQQQKRAEDVLNAMQQGSGAGVGPPGEGSIFQTEQWGSERPPQPSMATIMEETANKHFDKSLKMKGEGQHKSAILWINKAIGVKGEEVRFYVERAENYIRLCDFQSAILNYKKACLLEPSNEEFYNRLSFLYYFQGQSLFDQRLYPEALEAFSRAAEMRPDNVGYHIRSITCLAALQRHGECLALVNKRLETDKDNADLYVMRARLHEMFRNITLSYYDVKDALEINPGHSEAVRMMAKLENIARENKRQAMQLNLMGKHREALQKISIAIETDPAVADFHVLRGALHRKLGDYNAAIDDFLLALDKCDHNEDSPIYTDSQRQLLLTYNDFAVECFSKGFFEEAIILLNKAIKGEKREKGLYVNRGDCFFRQEEYNFAMQDYQQALELDPNNETIKSRISVIHNEFGVNAYQEKQFDEAENRFTQALEYHPKVGQYYISRARARYMMENITSARGDLLMGLLLDPQNEDVISILSRLFPGKSVGDVLGSRAAESAKYAIRNIFAPPRPAQKQEEEELSIASGDEGEEVDDNQSAKPEVETQSGEDESEATASMWRPETTVSEFKIMMDEQEFNVKLVSLKQDFKIMMDEQEFNVNLVSLKQDVNGKIKTALQDRRTLKYNGPRMQPLPPPQPKPTYGGRRAPRQEQVIKERKRGDYNWKQFNMGIGLGGN